MASNSSLIVISGHPRPGSRTKRLAESVGRALDPAFVTVDVADLGDDLAAAVEQIRAARAVVVATPTYKGSYTGKLKVLIDEFPHRGLAGITAIPVVTAGLAAQAEAADAHLRALLGELAATVVPASLRATDDDLADVDATVARYVKTVPWPSS
jgi:FMN reductase